MNSVLKLMLSVVQWFIPTLQTMEDHEYGKKPISLVDCHLFKHLMMFLKYNFFTASFWYHNLYHFACICCMSQCAELDTLVILPGAREIEQSTQWSRYHPWLSASALFMLYTWAMQRPRSKRGRRPSDLPGRPKGQGVWQELTSS